MTIFLHGSDGYRRTRRVQEAIRQFTDRYPGAAVRRIDAETDEAADETVAGILSSASLFSTRTLIVLENALTLTPARLKALVNRSSASATHHLVLVAGTDKPAKTYARLLEDDVTAEAFVPLTGKDWLAFVTREARARGLKPSAAALASLARAFAGDGWGIGTELDVLAAMPEELRGARLAETLGSLPAAFGWGDLRRLGSGDPVSRLVTLARIEAAGEPAAKTFAMAAYSAHPEAAADGDVAVKTGGWDFEEALVSLAIN